MYAISNDILQLIKEEFKSYLTEVKDFSESIKIYLSLFDGDIIKYLNYKLDDDKDKIRRALNEYLQRVATRAGWTGDDFNISIITAEEGGRRAYLNEFLRDVAEDILAIDLIDKINRSVSNLGAWEKIMLIALTIYIKFTKVRDIPDDEYSVVRPLFKSLIGILMRDAVEMSYESIYDYLSKLVATGILVESTSRSRKHHYHEYYIPSFVYTLLTNYIETDPLNEVPDSVRETLRCLLWR
ncbi:MAG: hypothetical protein ACP5IE_03480 [Infirmifilum sp.]